MPLMYWINENSDVPILCSGELTDFGLAVPEDFRPVYRSPRRAWTKYRVKVKARLVKALTALSQDLDRVEHANLAISKCDPVTTNTEC